MNETSGESRGSWERNHFARVFIIGEYIFPDTNKWENFRKLFPVIIGNRWPSPCSIIAEIHIDISRSPEILSRGYEAERKKRKREREGVRPTEKERDRKKGALEASRAGRRHLTERNVISRFTYFLATHHFHLQPPLILLALVLVLLHFFLRLSHLLLEHVEESALHLRRHAAK